MIGNAIRSNIVRSLVVAPIKTLKKCPNESLIVNINAFFKTCTFYILQNIQLSKIKKRNTIQSVLHLAVF